MSVNSKMTALADEIRELSGFEEKIGLDNMIENVNGANSTIQEETNLINQIITALKGKTIPSTPQQKQLILNKIDSIGELQGDGTVSETFVYTFEFDPSVTLLQLLLNQMTSSDSFLRNYCIIAATPSSPEKHTIGYLDSPIPGVQATFQNNVLTIKTAIKPSGNSLMQYEQDYITIICFDSNNNITDSCIIKIPAVHWTCYLKNTLITLANNQTKKVQDITYQDDLLVWDFDNGCYTSAKPLWIKKSEIATQYYHCTFEDNSTLDLVGSNGNCHAIFCLDTNQFEYANNCVGKTIMTQNGPTKLLSCEIITDIVEFYNIITNYHMNCYANNILTSTTLNNIYPIQNMQFIKDSRQIIPKDKFNIISQQYYDGLRLGEQNILPPEKIDKKIAILHNAKLKEV